MYRSYISLGCRKSIRTTYIEWQHRISIFFAIDLFRIHPVNKMKIIDDLKHEINPYYFVHRSQQTSQLHESLCAFDQHDCDQYIDRIVQEHIRVNAR
jgi:hypothetical protein